MSPRRTPHQLAKYVAYILERRPDEFGLVPDPQGFIKTKELLKAIREEPGLKSIRQGDLDEIRITLPNPPLEMVEDHLRGRNRQRLPKRTEPDNLPKLLYTCVRRRAYPHVHEKGIRPMGRNHIILSSDQELALRIGRRIDPDPVMLTVMTQAAKQHSITFLQAGTGLYLTQFIPSACFSGPPIPKEPEQPAHKSKPRPTVPVMPGSFTMDPDNFAAAIGGNRKKDPLPPGGKATQSRRDKKRKRKRERPPWRE